MTFKLIMGLTKTKGQKKTHSSIGTVGVCNFLVNLFTQQSHCLYKRWATTMCYYVA